MHIHLFNETLIAFTNVMHDFHQNMYGWICYHLIHNFFVFPLNFFVFSSHLPQDMVPNKLHPTVQIRNNQYSIQIFWQSLIWATALFLFIIEYKATTTHVQAMSDKSHQLEGTFLMKSPEEPKKSRTINKCVDVNTIYYQKTFRCICVFFH